MLDPGYYSEIELIDAGFKSVGKNVAIAKNCTIIGKKNISIGSNVRIDGYCTIIASGENCIKIGSYIHIGSYSFLSASKGIIMEDFSGISQGVRIYNKTDDYSGHHLTNPTVPTEYTNAREGIVHLERHVIIGSNSVILPNVRIGEGSSVGALSLITKNLDSWGVYFGAPVKKLKNRSKNLLQLEKKMLKTFP